MTSKLNITFIEVLKTCVNKYKFLLFICFALIIIPSYLMSASWSSYKKDRDFLRKVVLTEARVDKKEIEDYKILYSFKITSKKGVKEIKEEDIFKGKESIEKKQWENIKVDDSIQVTYQPDNPSNNNLRKGGRSPTIIKITTVFLSFFIGLGLITMYGFFKNLVYFTYKMLNFGEKVQAKITYLEDQIHYEYEDKEGKKHKDKTQYLSKELRKDLKENSEVLVYYDEEFSNKNIFVANNWKNYI